MTLATIFDFLNEVADPVADFICMLKDDWSGHGGVMPTIDNVMNYRSVDISNNEYILLGEIDEHDSFSGLGAKDYRRDVVLSLILKTDVSDYRARQMLEECRRIFRTREYWGSYQNVSLGRNINLSDRERKVFSYTFTMTAFRMEHT
jgi:hypothetical protein